MGKFAKKLLKALDKNGKSKEYEIAVEKSEEKGGRKSVWSKWSSKIARGYRKIKDTPHIPRILLSHASREMELWNDDETLSSNMVNIPIEPGRQISTILISPTKTGFKAVIAHYDVNAKLSRSLTKDFQSVTNQIESRRQLTLVFDMDQRTFTEIGVGENGGNDDDETGRPGRLGEAESISASALYVRNGHDEIVESAAFLQAQLSLDNSAVTESSLIFSDRRSMNLSRRHMSCKSFTNGYIGKAFKTISEPMWKEKEKIRKDMILKQNVQEMLNQFIFLERDDSFMNFSRTCTEDKRTNSVSSLIPEELSSTSQASSRHVAPDLLVNIKPFKQYISSNSRMRLRPRAMSCNEKISKKVCNAYFNPFRDAEENKSKALDTCKMKCQESVIKSKFALCIKCGTEMKKNDNDTSSRESGRRDGNKSDSDGLSTKNKKGKSLIVIPKINQAASCNLCSVWKFYKNDEADMSKMSLVGDSFDDIFKEFPAYDHDSLFRQNLPQFRTKITTQTVGSPRTESFTCTQRATADFKKSHSLLSFAEVIEVEENKPVVVSNRGSDPPPGCLQTITLRLIEIVRNNNEKMVEFHRLKKLVEESTLLKVFDNEESEIRTLENSIMLFVCRGNDKMSKTMAQKIEESMINSYLNAGEEPTSQTILKLPMPEGIAGPGRAVVEMQRLRSDDRLDEFRRSFSAIKRVAQIPDVINHLLTNKMDDVRNELITRINETRLGYGGFAPSDAEEPKIVEQTLLQDEKSDVAPSKSEAQSSDVGGQTWWSDNELVSETGTPKESVPPTPKAKISECSSTKDNDSTIYVIVDSAPRLRVTIDKMPSETTIGSPSSCTNCSKPSENPPEVRVSGTISQQGAEGNEPEVSSSIGVNTETLPETVAENVLFREVCVRACALSTHSTSASREGVVTKVSEGAGSTLGNPEKAPTPPTGADSTFVMTEYESSSFSMNKDASPSIVPTSNDSSLNDIVEGTKRIEPSVEKDGPSEDQPPVKKSSNASIPKEKTPSRGSSNSNNSVASNTVGDIEREHTSEVGVQIDHTSEVGVQIDQPPEPATVEDVATRSEVPLANDEASATAENISSINMSEYDGTYAEDNEKSSTVDISTPSLGANTTYSSELGQADTEDGVKGSLTQTKISRADERTSPIIPKQRGKNEAEEKLYRDVMTFTSSSDYKSHSSFAFFIPFSQQIQRAIEILNNVAYDFPVRKESKSDSESMSITNSPNNSENTNSLLESGIGSVFTKKCTEKNIVNGVEMMKTSKKEITKIENSKSGNHLLVTNKRILTTNDRIKKAELMASGNDSDVEREARRGRDKDSTVRSRISDDSIENLSGVQFLYCKMSEGNQTCDTCNSSIMSSDKELKISETTMDGDGKESEGCQVDIKSKEGDTAEEQSDAGSSDVGSRVDMTLSGSSSKGVRPDLSGKDASTTSTLKEESVAIKDSRSSRIAVPQRSRTSSVRMTKKVGEGIVSQRMAKSVNGENELVIRDDTMRSSALDLVNPQRMSVVIRLSKRKDEKDRPLSAPGKYITSDSKTKASLPDDTSRTDSSTKKKAITDEDPKACRKIGKLWCQR